MNIFSKLKQGSVYMQKWPNEPLLNPVFAENRVKKCLNAANYIIPPFIVLTLAWAIYLGGGFKYIPWYIAIRQNLEVTIISLLVLLLMPVQGYYLFYRRAITPLNDKQKKFYTQLCKKLDMQSSNIPNMSDLEFVINKALPKLGNEFLKDL